MNSIDFLETMSESNSQVNGIVFFRLLHRTCFTVVAVAALALSASLNGCHHQGQAPAKKPPLVFVDYPIKRDVTAYFETNGFAEAYEYTTIVARVPGELEQIRYKPGAIVFEGDPLFLIEQDRYLANRDGALADLASAKAELALAEANLKRSKVLRETNTNTQEEYDQFFAQHKVAEAKILQAEANLKNCELDLKYTDVRAPISGKTEQNLIDRGNYVGSTPENSSLTTIANQDPMYVYFSVSATQVNKLQEIRSVFDERTKAVLERLKNKNSSNKPEPPFLETPTNQDDPNREIVDQNNTGQQHEPNDTQTEAHPSSKIDQGDPKNLGVDVASLKSVASSFKFENHLISVALHKEAGEKFDFKYDGVIDLSSNRVDPHTGTIKFRGKIPNENYVIFPKQPVQVRIPLYVQKDAVVIREEAVGSDLNMKYVFVVDKDGVVSRKDVELGPLQSDGTRVVIHREGVPAEKQLTHSDRYIVQGIQKASVGQKVTMKDEKEVEKEKKEKEEKKKQDAKNAKDDTKNKDDVKSAGQTQQSKQQQSPPEQKPAQKPEPKPEPKPEVKPEQKPEQKQTPNEPKHQPAEHAKQPPEQPEHTTKDNSQTSQVPQKNNGEQQ